MILLLLKGVSITDLRCRRIGAPLLFERPCRDSGYRALVEELLTGRRFEFAVERAAFLTVLHRLMVSGSDRDCEYWRDDYRIEGGSSLVVSMGSGLEVAWDLMVLPGDGMDMGSLYDPLTDPLSAGIGRPVARPLAGACTASILSMHTND
jgi:hypothetical protein